MHKIKLFAVAAALILVGSAGWVATSAHARVEAPVTAEGIDPSQIMMNAKNLPVEHFLDYSFEFN
jgi:hypothetical protein